MTMQLREWMRAASDSERERLATEASTSVAYLWQLAGGHRKASIELASRIQAASGGVITIAGLRPDIQALMSAPQATNAHVLDRRSHPGPDDHRGRRTTDPTESEIQALRESAEKALALADRLAG